MIRYAVQLILADALEREVQRQIERCAHLTDDKGHRVVVRKGISGNAFEEAMKVLLGDRASVFSKNTVAMKHQWLAEMEAWRQCNIDE